MAVYNISDLTDKQFDDLFNKDHIFDGFKFEQDEDVEDSDDPEDYHSEDDSSEDPSEDPPNNLPENNIPNIHHPQKPSVKPSSVRPSSSSSSNDPIADATSSFYDDLISDLYSGDIPDDLFSYDDSDEYSKYSSDSSDSSSTESSDHPKYSSSNNTHSKDTIPTHPDYASIAQSLTVGQTIKNYKKLCFIFQMKPTTGTAKIAQLKTISQYLSFEKIGHSFFIKEIYPVEKTRQDKRSYGNHSIYLPYIEQLLTFYLQKNNNSLQVSKTELLDKFGMITGQFSDLLYNRTSFEQISQNIPNVTEKDVQKFSMYIISRMYAILNRSIKNMIDRNIIHCSEVYYFVKREYQGISDKYVYCQELIKDQNIIEQIKRIEKTNAMQWLTKDADYNNYKKQMNMDIQFEFGMDGILKRENIVLCCDDLKKIPDSNISLIKNKLNKRMIEHFESVFRRKYKKQEKQNIYLDLISFYLDRHVSTTTD